MWHELQRIWDAHMRDVVGRVRALTKLCDLAKSRSEIHWASKRPQVAIHARWDQMVHVIPQSRGGGQGGGA
jgi:hypothetical protein